MLSKFKGHISIDVRIWFRTERGELRPSRRGVSLRLPEVSDIRAGLRKAQEIAVEVGLIGLPVTRPMRVRSDWGSSASRSNKAETVGVR